MNKFTIGEALKAGWEKAKKNVGSFFLILLACWVVSALIGGVLSVFEDGSALSFLVLLVGVVVVGTFLQMGITRIMLKVLDGGKAAISDFTANPAKFGNFLLGSLLSMFLILLGFIVFIIPGLILAIRLQFVPYLIVEKDLTPMAAVKRSLAITRGEWWHLFFFGIVSGLVGLLGFIALVIGLLWAIPTTMIALAYVYRKLENAAADTLTQQAVAV